MYLGRDLPFRLLSDRVKTQSKIAGRRIVRTEAVDIAAFLQSCRDESAPLAEPRAISVEIDVGSRPIVEADPARLRQVVDSLLSNAIKHSPRGGAVQVRADVTDSGALQIEVADRGPGIPEAELSHLFREYGQVASQAASSLPSVGLGLSIVKQSVVGEGTTFAVTLPGALR